MRFAVVLACTLSLTGQDARFDARSRLVLIPVTVTDSKGRVVDGLEAPDFLVVDNGRAQKVIVDTIATGVAPIALVVAVQASGISGPVLDKVRKIGSMIQPLLTGDRGCAALVSFAELHTQYVLSFVPESTTPGFHPLDVRVNRSGKFRIRSRPGYWRAEGSP